MLREWLMVYRSSFPTLAFRPFLCSPSSRNAHSLNFMSLNSYTCASLPYYMQVTNYNSLNRNYANMNLLIGKLRPKKKKKGKRERKVRKLSLWQVWIVARRREPGLRMNNFYIATKLTKAFCGVSSLRVWKTSLIHRIRHFIDTLDILIKNRLFLFQLFQ